MSKYGVFSGLYFSSVQIRESADQNRAESVDSFHAVNIPGIFCAKILIFGERRRGTYKSFT